MELVRDNSSKMFKLYNIKCNILIFFKYSVISLNIMNRLIPAKSSFIKIVYSMMLYCAFNSMNAKLIISVFLDVNIHLNASRIYRQA